ncbi:MAG: hypothetical protein ACE5E6_00995 [Phycisphaerae bacterium]
MGPVTSIGVASGDMQSAAPAVTQGAQSSSASMVSTTTTVSGLYAGGIGADVRELISGAGGGLEQNRAVQMLIALLILLALLGGDGKGSDESNALSWAFDGLGQAGIDAGAAAGTMSFHAASFTYTSVATSQVAATQAYDVTGGSAGGGSIDISV